MLTALIINKANAGETLSEAVTEKKIKLTVIVENMPPFQIVKNNSISGYSVELLKQILAKTDIDYSIMSMNWARAVKYTQERNNTLLLSMVRTAEREDKFHWLVKVDSGYSSLWSLSSNTVPLSSLKEINDKVISVHRGDHQSSMLKNIPEINDENLVETSTQEQAIALLVRQRVDFTIANERIFSWRLKTLGYERELFNKVIDIKENANQFYIVSGLNMPAKVREKIKRASKIFLLSPEKAELDESWQNKE